MCGRPPRDRDAEKDGPGHVGNTGEMLPVQIAGSLDRGSGHDVGTTDVDGQEKNGKLTKKGFRPIAILPTMYRLYSKVLQQLAGQAFHSRYGPQYGHVLGRQAHGVVFILRRMVEQANEWRILIFLMDCDVAAAFDRVSHHLIIDAMEALSVPPVLVAASIRENRRLKNAHQARQHFDAREKRRTRSVPQGGPCAANLFGAALDVPATAFCKKGQTEKWRLPVDRKYMGLLLFADTPAGS